MKCLIVAAGQGTRLREKGELKPLIPIRGVPLIERVIANGKQAGVDEFIVVTGYRADALQAHLGEFAKRTGIHITRIFNRAWDRANGVSVLAGPSAYFCKHPPVQYTDDIAHEMTEEFIRTCRPLLAVTAAE